MIDRLRSVALVAVLIVLAACTQSGGEEQIQTADPGEAEEKAENRDDGEGGEGGSVSLLGAGASFPDPVYQEWISDYAEVEPEVSIQYEAIGSGGGRERFIAQETDFGGSDAFMSDEEIAAAEDARGCGEVLHIPAVFGGVVVAYNIPELEGETLVLDADTTAGIFSGEITNINDDAIAELNPDVDLPDQELTVARRSDGSGTTQTFTLWLESENEEWAEEFGSGDTVDWIGESVGGEQNDGVTSIIDQQPGAIGYLSLEFARESGLPYADIVNADGNAIEPTTESVGKAVDNVDLPEDLRFDILDVGGEGYPIATATWLLAYSCGYDDDVAGAMRDYFTWALEEGGDTAAELGYAPLSESAREASLEKVEQINADE